VGQEREPWVVTDERLPCLVVEGEISPPTNVCGVKASLDRYFTRISNVYNCAAYDLDNECGVAFCIRRSGKAALVFINLDSDVDDGGFEGLREKIKGPQQRIEEIIAADGTATIKFDHLRIEITGKTPN
jgi:hypothetical protein